MMTIEAGGICHSRRIFVLPDAHYVAVSSLEEASKCGK